MENETNHVQQKVDIAVIKEKVEQHDGFINEMRENHLPHIYNRLVKIETKMAWYAGAIVAIGSVIQLAITYFVK